MDPHGRRDALLDRASGHAFGQLISRLFTLRLRLLAGQAGCGGFGGGSGQGPNVARGALTGQRRLRPAAERHAARPQSAALPAAGVLAQCAVPVAHATAAARVGAAALMHALCGCSREQ